MSVFNANKVSIILYVWLDLQHQKRPTYDIGTYLNNHDALLTLSRY